MSRSDMMARLLRLARLAERCELTGENPDEAIGQDRIGNESRRNFAKGVVAATTTAAAWSVSPGALAAAGKAAGKVRLPGVSGNIAVVGAGLAGLSCAYELARLGINARVFEADQRVGGRCASLRGVFPGQVVERGGEFFSRSHHTLVGYARSFGLPLESNSARTGSDFFHFRGRSYTEAQVLAEYRAFAGSIRQDLGALSYPTADRFNENDELFDYMSLDDYLTLHEAGPLLRALVSSAYLAEYGAGIDELSSVSFLRFIYGDRRSKQAPFGLGSGELLRVADGNDRIATGLADRLPTPVTLGHRLVSVRGLSGGRVRLSFEVGGATIQSDHDAVVMTLPFSVLRDVELHSSLQLPLWKRMAIRTAQLGTHSKLLVGFNSQVWSSQHGLNGTGFSDRNFMQSTWEANPSKARAGHAVLASLVGGAQARGMTAASAQADASAFVANLEAVFPGASAAAARDGAGNIKVHSENWAGNRWSKGSLTCNQPGYFTTTAHNEGKAVGRLLFAGEHTSSFYEWQGFMEGAAISGLRAAGEVAALVRPAAKPGARVA